MGYFIEIIERGGVVLSAAGLVSFLILYTFDLTSDNPNKGNTVDIEVKEEIEVKE